jgi:hypothetical protein
VSDRERGCCSCRNGGIDREADVYVTGTVVDAESYRRRPFQGYLCHDHADMLLDDGAKLKERPVREGPAEEHPRLRGM